MLPKLFTMLLAAVFVWPRLVRSELSVVICTCRGLQPIQVSGPPNLRGPPVHARTTRDAIRRDN